MLSILITKNLTNPDLFKCLFMRELEKYPARCLSCKLLYEANGLQGKTEMIANVCQQFNNNCSK